MVTHCRLTTAQSGLFFVTMYHILGIAFNVTHDWFYLFLLTFCNTSTSTLTKGLSLRLRNVSLINLFLTVYAKHEKCGSHLIQPRQRTYPFANWTCTKSTVTNGITSGISGGYRLVSTYDLPDCKTILGHSDLDSLTIFILGGWGVFWDTRIWTL